jgi:hypothetical protein
MDGFPNVLGVLVAEHLINNLDSERCAPVIKAVVRDLKKYMSLKQQVYGQRPLPVGFGGGSYKYDRKVLDYMTVGDADSCVDFWTVCSITRDWPTASLTDDAAVYRLPASRKIRCRYERPR